MLKKVLNFFKVNFIFTIVICFFLHIESWEVVCYNI